VTVLVKAKSVPGITSEITHKAEDVFAWLGFIAPLQARLRDGLRHHPDCTGCDHDDFIDPGAEIQIISSDSAHSDAVSPSPRANSCQPLASRPQIQKYHA